MRSGVSSHISEEDRLDLLGEKTKFRNLCSSLVNKVVSTGKWFTFCTKVSDEQVDIMRLKNSKGDSLGSFIKNVYGDCSYRTSIYKYLLRDFLCYYEAPIVIKESNTLGYRNSFNKYLITSNIGVVAIWLGISVEEAQKKYGSRLYEVNEDNGCNLFPYVKLYETKEGERKVSKPRNDIDLGLAGTRVIPLFALKEGVDFLYRCLSKDTYDVFFYKDSGQKRSMNITFNLDKIREIYKDDSYVSEAVDLWYRGSFLDNSAMERGYIRVFEMGSSIYDSPLRSINFARIVGFEKAEPDLAYMNVDIESALDAFKLSVDGNSFIDNNIEEFVESLEVFEVGTERKFNNMELSSTRVLLLWADAQAVLLSTVFLRQLSLFMLGNPKWFSDYTGEPTDSYASVATDIDDFGLDIG